MQRVLLIRLKIAVLIVWKGDLEGEGQPREGKKKVNENRRVMVCLCDLLLLHTLFRCCKILIDWLAKQDIYR